MGGGGGGCPISVWSENFQGGRGGCPIMVGGNFLGGCLYPFAYYDTGQANPVMGEIHSGGVGSILYT